MMLKSERPEKPEPEQKRLLKTALRDNYLEKRRDIIVSTVVASTGFAPFQIQPQSSH